MIRSFRFWLYRLRHDHPCKEEMKLVLIKTKVDPFSRSFIIGMSYALHKAPIESVAVEFNLTRERVRQVLWKLWRSAR